jgi:carboxymethylenebutenolidase
MNVSEPVTQLQIDHEAHIYFGTQHNNSTPRYNEPAATLSWERTIAFFKKHLA